MKSYLDYIWHNPNCAAWHRNPNTNKDYKHIAKKFGISKCTCGFDEDFKRLQRFKNSYKLVKFERKLLELSKRLLL